MDRRVQLESEESRRNGELLNRSGSFRKVLPSKPSATVDSRLSMSMKMIDRPVVTNMTRNINKTMDLVMLEYAILAEYQMLQKQELPGIYVIPSDQDPLVWFGVIFIHQGLYKEGVFRFLLTIPDNFPDGECPRITFESSIFHPAIDLATGELNMSEEFQEWNRKMNHIWQILQYVKRVFFKLETKSPNNPEALEMFLKDSIKFQDLARKSVDESLLRLYSSPNPSLADDNNYIHFEPYTEAIHDGVRGQLTSSDKIRHF